MDISQLREYKNWINKTPTEIRNAVIAAGGWAQVFPKNIKFPEWASRVRNFFNVTPVSLVLLGPIEDRFIIKPKPQRLFIDPSAPTEILHLFALNGDVYLDENRRPWLDMAKPGTIYHYPGKVGWKKKLAAIGAQVHGIPMPIFKLISPDNTGGSLEVCLYNRNQTGRIGKVGQVVPVSPQLVSNEVYSGSYNYSETVIRGLPEHEHRDVKPHKDDMGFYVNPPNYSPISDRRFPARFNGHPWEYEFGLEPFEFDSTRPDPLRRTDVFANQMSPPHYPRNDRRSLDLVKNLEYLFRSSSAPKRLLARIEARDAKDKAVKDFHNPAILAPDTVRRLLMILRDRPPGVEGNVASSDQNSRF